MNSSAFVFPLYLYDDSLGEVKKTPNLNPEIVAKIAAAINDKHTDLLTPNGVREMGGPRFVAATDETKPVPPEDVSRVSGEQIRVLLSPEDIFDYIYAVLHTPEYRSRYKEFLKVDFPRIPYPRDAATFRKLVEIGAALRKCHLMQDAPPPLSESVATFPVQGDNVVEKVRLVLTGRVYINATQYFDNVAEADFNFFIGGYQPAQKWLKDRKGRALALDDLRHYQRIIVALRRTRELMARLSELSDEWLA